MIRGQSSEELFDVTSSGFPRAEKYIESRATLADTTKELGAQAAPRASLGSPWGKPCSGAEEGIQASGCLPSMELAVGLEGGWDWK